MNPTAGQTTKQIIIYWGIKYIIHMYVYGKYLNCYYAKVRKYLNQIDCNLVFVKAEIDTQYSL